MIYTGSVNIQLHPVSSHTKMVSTKSQQSFAKRLQTKLVLEPIEIGGLKFNNL